MCPLRLILIFLSATLAGFFVLRNLNSQPKLEQADDDDVGESVNSSFESSTSPPTPVKPASKVFAALSTGFWTCVDMASGRYLWRNLVKTSSSKLGD